MKNLSETELRNLSGEKARLWRFLPSHDRLVFRLGYTDDVLEKYLVFLGCEKMNITVFWKIGSPKIVKGERASYKLIDGDIQIQFEESRLMERFELT